MKNRDKFMNLVRAIAHDLGKEWLFDATWETENPASAKLVGPGDTRIHIRCSTYDYLPDDGSRLEISGSYPYHPRHGSFGYGQKCPFITVAASRSSSAIAKDIHRRFLPGYLVLYQKAQEAKQDYEAGLAKQKDAIRQLAEILGTEAGRGRVYLPAHLNCYGRIEVNEGSDVVRFDLSSVPIKLAIKLAAVLAEFGGEDE